MSSNAKPVRIPGPEHPITLSPNPARIVVRAADRTIADTRAALTLQEASYPAVQYIPREDVDMTLLARSEHTTYCPYKGDCRYFSIPSAGQRGVDAVWTYEEPYAAVSQIREYLAFYPDRVQLSEMRPGG
jgi:uncharacterized protein (DUF427 family)